jgi:hypothetical protein
VKRQISERSRSPASARFRPDAEGSLPGIRRLRRRARRRAPACQAPRALRAACLVARRASFRARGAGPGDESNARRIRLRPQVEAAVSRETSNCVAAYELAGCAVEMPWCLEFIERILIPLVGDHVLVIVHQRLEAVRLGGLDGIGRGEPSAGWSPSSSKLGRSAAVKTGYGNRAQALNLPRAVRVPRKAPSRRAPLHLMRGGDWPCCGSAGSTGIKIGCGLLARIRREPGARLFRGSPRT